MHPILFVCFCKRTTNSTHISFNTGHDKLILINAHIHIHAYKKEFNGLSVIFGNVRTTDRQIKVMINFQLFSKVLTDNCFILQIMLQM